jgi:nucleoside 2-deoxyribosyltransferase
MTIYWAAPLFTQAERTWNRQCAAVLREKGYTVVLPQDEAAPYIKRRRVDSGGIAEHCYKQSVSCDLMIVVLDGADTDSGTSLEAGLRIGHWRLKTGTRKTIGVRTDFRRSEDKHVNAMFNLLDDVIYFASFNEDVRALCKRIHKVIERLSF